MVVVVSQTLRRYYRYLCATLTLIIIMEVVTTTTAIHNPRRRILIIFMELETFRFRIQPPPLPARLIPIVLTHGKPQQQSELFCVILVSQHRRNVPNTNQSNRNNIQYLAYRKLQLLLHNTLYLMFQRCLLCRFRRPSHQQHHFLSTIINSNNHSTSIICYMLQEM